MQSRNYPKYFIKKQFHIQGIYQASLWDSSSKNAIGERHLLDQKCITFLAPIKRNETMELNSTGVPMLQEKHDSKCPNLLQKFEG